MAQTKEQRYEDSESPTADVLQETRPGPRSRCDPRRVAQGQILFPEEVYSPGFLGSERHFCRT